LASTVLILLLFKTIVSRSKSKHHVLTKIIKKQQQVIY